MEIFVFGSNLAGRHGKGGALWAKQHKGAIYGRCCGIQGESYGIPTKDENIRTLPLPIIRTHVDYFIDFAKAHPDLTFKLTAIGTGLANYKAYEIAPMFKDAPLNVLVPLYWQEYLPNHFTWEGENTENYDTGEKKYPLFD